MSFIKRARGGLASCVFCELPAQNQDEQNYILARGTHSFIILNRYPYNAGHLMVIPYAHTADFLGLSPEVLLEMQQLLQRAMAALAKVYGPAGYNLGMNLGEAGGAGIKEHLHYHVVPRWLGDSNYMPVVGQTKVIPESLGETYQKLKAHL